MVDEPIPFSLLEIEVGFARHELGPDEFGFDAGGRVFVLVEADGFVVDVLVVLPDPLGLLFEDFGVFHVVFSLERIFPHSVLVLHGHVVLNRRDDDL